MRGGQIQDARLFGDGYDFQIELSPRFILAEVKGLQTRRGAVRLTEKEFRTAEEYSDDYALIVVSNLQDSPRLNLIQNPTRELKLRRQIITAEAVTYHSEALTW